MCVGVCVCQKVKARSKIPDDTEFDIGYKAVLI